jgi:hypothetical protein
MLKNRTFYFFSYEGLRHLQGVDLNSGVLTEAQRAAVTDPVSRRLLQFIPLPNTTAPAAKDGSSDRAPHRSTSINHDRCPPQPTPRRRPAEYYAFRQTSGRN